MHKNIAIILASVIIAVAGPSITEAHGPIACTVHYAPVCGTEQGVYKTYGNSCELGSTEGAVFQHQGECTAAELKGTQEGTYTPPAHCTAWNDGCNSCGRGPDGQSFCTLRACLGEPRAGYCTAYADSETDDPAPVRPHVAVSSDISVADVDSDDESPDDASVVVEATSTATASEETDPGFLFGIWRAISAWFGNLF